MMVKRQTGNNGKAVKKTRLPAKGKIQDKGQAVLKDLSYEIGCISGHTVDGIKKSIDADTCKKIGKSIGALCNNIEGGWRNPEKVIGKDGIITIKKGMPPFGKVIGSGAKSSINVLSKTYKMTAGYLGKAFIKGSTAALVAAWKIEHPKATKTQEQEAVSEIKKLFKP